MANCVYIHIPFCVKKCNYCAFCSFGLLKKKDDYINALLDEIEFFYKNEPLKTIYFGGGTPSLLDIDDFRKILSKLNYNSKTQITLEMNPTSVTKEKLFGVKNLKIDRLSLGVQSFDDEILKIIGRTHKKEDIFNSIDLIKKMGFKNLSIDLMYGLPSQTLKNWEETLETALKLNIEHISLYGLKIEEGTYFYHNPPKNLANDELQAKMYELAIEKLKNDFIYYEFSNFAKNESYFSKHNLAYWNRYEYYGFGLSASGFIDKKRYTNTFNFSEYLKNPKKEKDFEILSPQNEIEEEIFLGLRLISGINLEKINEKYNIDTYKMFKKEFDEHIKNGFLKKEKNIISLTQKGILVSNEILCDFIKV